MHRTNLHAATVVMVVGWNGFAAADTVCQGDILFQCATQASDSQEQITVCASHERYALTRHELSSGRMYYDVPLVVDAETSWFNWVEGNHVQIEMGFWSTDLGEPVTLHVHLPWDDENETVAKTGPGEMWLQSPHWRERIEQTMCQPETIYTNLEALWPAQLARGPVGTFFSQDTVMPTSATVGVAHVKAVPISSEGVPVFASARPNAATPIWWMLQPGETVDIIDQNGDFFAVAIPTNGVTSCMLRPERLDAPYNGPCATGWVDGAYLDRVQ